MDVRFYLWVGLCDILITQISTRRRWLSWKQGRLHGPHYLEGLGAGSNSKRFGFVVKVEGSTPTCKAVAEQPEWFWIRLSTDGSTPSARLLTIAMDRGLVFGVQKMFKLDVVSDSYSLQYNFIIVLSHYAKAC